MTFCPVSLLQAFCVDCAVLSSMRKSRSVVKQFMMIAEPVQELSFCVKRTSPDTENHDKNGYAKVYDNNNIFITNVDNDNCDTTYTDKHMCNM